MNFQPLVYLHDSTNPNSGAADASAVILQRLTEKMLQDFLLQNRKERSQFTVEVSGAIPGRNFIHFFINISNEERLLATNEQMATRDAIDVEEISKLFFNKCCQVIKKS